MMAGAWGMLLMPMCATVAGAVVASTGRKESLDDGDLVRDFMVVFGVALLIVLGIGRQDFVRMRTDPEFRLQTQLSAHPVYAALGRTPQDQKVLHDFLILQTAQGKTLPEAFLQARPLLDKLATERLGWADQKAVLGWGQVTVDTLKELALRDPMLCYQAIGHQAFEAQTLAQAFTADNTKAFEQAVVDIYVSANYGWRPQEDPIDFNTVGLEYYSIKQRIANRYGQPVAEALSTKTFPAQPEQPATQLCTARIAQLEAFLDRPPAMAKRLLDGVLR
jgi:hypothetical protein